jgi:hypothetical protein
MNRSTQKTGPDIVIVQKVCDLEGRGLNPYLRDGLPDEEKTGGKGGNNAIGPSPNTTALGCTCSSAERLENSWEVTARGNIAFGTKKSGAMGHPNRPSRSHDRDGLDRVFQDAVLITVDRHETNIWPLYSFSQVHIIRQI